VQVVNIIIRAMQIELCNVHHTFQHYLHMIIELDGKHIGSERVVQ
jgi:hypothetical protein